MQSQKVLLHVAGFTIVLALAGCGGSTSIKSATQDPPGNGAGPGPNPGPGTSPPGSNLTADEHLATPRFTIHQPRVLEQIGAHHAYARGLTGEGVTIGIEDSIVDWTQTGEFGSRVELAADKGAVLANWKPFANIGFRTDIDACQEAIRAMTGDCAFEEVDSTGKSSAETINEAVKDIVAGPNGWPTRKNSLFIRDNAYDERHPLRWWEVTNPYSSDHGTVVASTAGGATLGVAPAATLVPIARDVGEGELVIGLSTIPIWVARQPQNEQASGDDFWAERMKESYRYYDIINRSAGPIGRRRSKADFERDAELVKNLIPKTWDAYLQTAVADDDKTIIVYAAGNEGKPEPDELTSYPYYLVEARGWWLAVVAADPDTRQIAGYSDHCGPLPGDWNATQHGPHFCLTAPGTVRGLVPVENSPGRGRIDDRKTGTSYAAPIVAGSLALLMEHFRGMRGNTAVVKRMLDTADRNGAYADLEIYGAGHLDLEAALSPVGSLNAGQHQRDLSNTRLSLPTAFGSVQDRIDGLELATFDEQDFPFWMPVSELVSMSSVGRSPIPEFDDTGRTGAPGAGLEALGLLWAPVSGEDLDQTPGWVAGFGPTSASLARTPNDESWGYGFSFSDGEYIGGQSSGAFGSDLRSGMIWSSRSVRHELAGGWSVEATGTLALSGPQYEQDAIFQASPSIMSAASIRVGTEETGLTLEQPLRAETGTGTLRLETGELENGRRRYDEQQFALEPDAREMRLTLRHEREAAGGRVAFQIVGALDADHTPGRSWSGAGVAYTKAW